MKTVQQEKLKLIKGNNLSNNSGIYFIFNKENKQIKIGKSNNIENRLKQFKQQMKLLGYDPNSLELLYFIDCINYSKLETYLHTLFSNYRKIGEWFEIDENRIKAIIKTINAKEFNKENVSTEYNCFNKEKSIKEIADEYCDIGWFKEGSYGWCHTKSRENIRNIINNDDIFVKFNKSIFKIINSNNIRNNQRPTIICDCFDLIVNILSCSIDYLNNFDWTYTLNNFIENKMNELNKKENNIVKYWDKYYI